MTVLDSRESHSGGFDDRRDRHDHGRGGSEPGSAAAERAVRGVVADLEMTYVQTLNAMLLAPASPTERGRRAGYAEAVRSTAEELRRALGDDVPPYHSSAWRRANGVLTEAQAIGIRRRTA